MNTELRFSISWNNFAERVCDVIEAERLFAPEDAEYNAGFVDQMVELGTQNTESGKYAYHFATFGKDEGYVRAHCDEIKETMLARVEVKDVQSDEWYIHATFYKDYCAKLQGTEEARQEHKERIAEIADKIIEEGTKNTTEGNYLDTYYDQFKGWAESFDAATNEEKKMIICKLISRIEVGRGYKVNIILNMDYGQFVGE